MNKQEQIDQWSKLYGRQITEEEYKEICNNLNGFFKILQEWDREDEKVS
jgi:hypothetical protein